MGWLAVRVLNPTEQVHACFKANVKQQLTSQQIARELGDEVGRLTAQMTKQMANCTQSWCRNALVGGRVAKYIPADFHNEVIVELVRFMFIQLTVVFVEVIGICTHYVKLICVLVKVTERLIKVAFL